MIEGEVDTRDVDRGLAGLLRAGRDIEPVLHEAKAPLRSDLREHHRARRGPDGPWPSPAPATVRKRGRTKSGRRRRRRPLGRLPGANTMRVIGQALEVRSRVRWARVQQFGGRVARGAQLPPRPYLYFGRGFVADFEAALRAHLTRGWSR